MSGTFLTYVLHLQPHDVPEKWKSNVGPRSRSLEDDRGGSNSSSRRGSLTRPPPPNSKSNNRISKAKNRNLQKDKLDATLLRLLAKMPTKSALDASYLLESDKRLRKKSVAHINPNLT